MHCNTENSTTEMRETELIDQIIDALGLDCGKVNTKWTPAE